MLPKHRQLCAPCPKASGNPFQALVNPPHDRNNLCFDGSDDNSIVIAYTCDSEPPVSASLQKDIVTLSHLDRTAMALMGFQPALIKLAENYDTNDLYLHELYR
jgi:hypothetical protein